MSESKHTSDQLIGCGDHSCLFVRPQGLGTNGGCRCAREPGRLAHNVRVLRRQRDELLAALKAIVSNSMFEQRFDHCGFMNATALSDRDLFRKLWAKARDAIEKAEGRSDGPG